MTKEECWDKNVAGWRLSMTDKGHANALKAMDEWAKINALEFIEWYTETLDECVAILNSKSRISQQSLDKVNQFELATNAERYELFLKSKKQ